jgi:hypothetical protein
MAVNEKYGGIDGHTGRQEVVDDFIETMTIERNKQKINKMLNNSLNLSLFHRRCGFKLIRSVI